MADRMANQKGTVEDATRVYNEWLARQARPKLCRLTSERLDLIRKRLGLGYSADDLCTLIRYAYESSDRGPRWWRGENEDRVTYLDLASLFRVEKLGARMIAALTWAETGDQQQNPAIPTNAPQGLVLIRGGRRIAR